MAAIKILALKKSFKDVKAVNGISLNVYENRIYGFLGPNGAGKTTTIRMLVGLSKPDSGEIEILGKKQQFGKPESNKLFGYLPENPAFYNWMTGSEYLKFVLNLFGADNVPEKINGLLKKVGLTDAGKKIIGGYSNGMKQRLGIAQTLAGDPKVLIMDEPVSALDPIGRKEVLGIIEELKTEKTIFMSTHILADVDRICDDIAIIDRGKLLVESSLTELKEKYAKPILEVEFAKDPGSLVPDIKKQNWQKKVEQNGRTLKIWLVSSQVIDENRPLLFFAQKKATILGYGLKMPEVEDLFIEMVGKND